MRYAAFAGEFLKAFVRGFLSDMLFYLAIIVPLFLTLWMVT